MSLILIIGCAVVVVLAAGYFFFVGRKPALDLTDDERAILKARFFDQFEIKGFRKRALLSTMYRAIDKESKKAVALRILRPEYSSDPDQVKSFLRRGEILEYLNKQHSDLALVRLLKYGQAPAGRFSRPFIAVEYFEGTDLSELLENRRVLTVSEATTIVTQIGKVLTAALRERVWHHQLAFQAIMVSQKDGAGLDARLVDFDVAKQEIGTYAGQSAEGISKLTFMSPEQFENKIVDERSDIYSLGVIYYTLLTGRPPFMGADFAEMARLHTSELPPQMPSHVPQAVQTIVLRMLAKQPLARFKAMDETIQAIIALKPDPAWNVQPDTSHVKPLVFRVEDDVTVRRQPGERPSARSTESSMRQERSGRKSSGSGKLGGFLSFVLLEIPMMFVSFVGKMITNLVKKVSVKKFVIVGLLLVAGVAAYFIFRSNAVKGTIQITLVDPQKKAVASADVAIDPLDGANQSATFIDPVKDQKLKGKATGKTDNKGEFKVEFAVPPHATLAVAITAADHIPNPFLDTIRVREDSTIVLVYSLAPKPKPVETPKVVTATVHDKARNPVPAVTIILSGKSGTDVTAQSDSKGKAALPYDVAAEGSSAQVTLSAEALGADFARSKPKQFTIAGAKLDIDVNDFFPYDEMLGSQMRQARFLIKEEEWKKAIPVLQQVLTVRPGQGSAEAYALLAQAMFEKDDDDYKDVLKLLDKAMLDKNSLTGSGSELALETMHYYRVVATYEAYRRLKSSDPTRSSLQRAVLRACNDYKDIYSSSRLKSLRQNDKHYKNNYSRVEDYLDKVH
jgi:serine/threonine protein kinase